MLIVKISRKAKCMHSGDTILPQEKTGEQSSEKSHRTFGKFVKVLSLVGSNPDLAITTEDKPNSILIYKTRIAKMLQNNENCNCHMAV